MAWQVEYTDQFREWWDTLSEEQQEDPGGHRGTADGTRTHVAVSPHFRDSDFAAQSHERAEDAERG